MADEYFPSGGDDAQQQGSTLEGPGGPPKAEDGAETEEGSDETALMPKSMFGDAKPGDTITVKVKRVFEQEIEVEPAGKEEAAESPEGQSEMDSSTGQLDQMSA